MQNSDGLSYGKKLPFCLRKYDRGNVICDGRPGARTQEDRIPCVYRDRCVAFSHLLKVKNEAPGNYIKLRKMRDSIDGIRKTFAFSKMDSSKFQQLLIRVIDKYGIKDGIVTIRQPIDKKVKRKRRRKISDKQREINIKNLAKGRIVASGLARERAKNNLNKVKELAKWFLKQLKKETGINIKKSFDDASVGEFFYIYFKSKTSERKYITIYIKRKEKRKIGRIDKFVVVRWPILSIRFVTRHVGLRFSFTLPPSSVKKAMPESPVDQIQIVPMNFGRYKSKTMLLGKEGCRIVIKIITRLIKNKLIDIPEVDENCKDLPYWSNYKKDKDNKKDELWEDNSF